MLARRNGETSTLIRPLPKPKRRVVTRLVLLLGCFSLERIAHADDAPLDVQRLLTETGRPEVAPAEDDLVRVQVHGEYQARYQVMRSFPLDPTASLVARAPGVSEDSLGQNQ